MGQKQSNVRAIAEQKSLIVRIPVEYTDQWLTRFQSWKSYLMNSYRQRFEELLETIDSIAFLNMDERLEKFFRDRFQATGEKFYKGKHQDIACQLNTSREVVSRLLKKMEQKGMIKIYRGKIDFSMLADL